MSSLVLEQMRPRPVYITHRYQAAMGEPVGDPFGGPAYGEKRAPAIAVFGAFSGIAAGLSVGGLLGGVMIAGGVMSGLGAITGNKTLSTLGMVSGLAGGVGQFVQQGGFESFSRAFQADGLSGVADQFTGKYDYGNAVYDYGAGTFDSAASTASNFDSVVPGEMIDHADPNSVYSDPASQVQAQLNNPAAASAQTVGQAIVQPTTTKDILKEKSGAEFEGVAEGMMGPGVDSATPATTGATQSGESSGGFGLLSSGFGLLSSGAGLVKKAGELWDKSGDFTKMAVVNAAAGGVKGLAEASDNKKLMGIKERQLDLAESQSKSESERSEALVKRTEAETKAIEKKNSGVPVVGIGEFGANRSAAFGRGADGNYRTQQQYIADTIGIMRRTFDRQTATA